jgi:hypothetical protein
MICILFGVGELTDLAMARTLFAPTGFGVG